MKLKKLHTTFMVLAVAVCNLASAQLFIDNAQFTIQPGATVTVQGDVTSNTDILGTGTLQMNGTAAQNLNMNGYSIPNLEINNAANVNLTGIAIVTTNILFTAGNILLGSNDLKIGSTATITNATNARFVVTNGAGRLVKAALGTTAFNFPIGKSTSSYEPVLIANSGAPDSIGARAFASVLTAGSTGAAFSKEVVNNSWDITEKVAGGSNLSITASWSTGDELPGFNRTKAGLSYYITSPAANLGWDLLNSQTGTATGSNPYSYTRTGVANLGTFAVGARPVLSPLLITPKVFLQGAGYNTVLNIMSDLLRTVVVAGGGTTDATHGVIPLTEPYTALGFTHAGSGGNETISSSVLGSLGDNSIVDWVFVQLHDGASGAVISTRSALLQKDGDIVETDGTTPCNMAGNAAGNYYFSVRHRNHLGIRTLSNIALAKTIANPYNFTTSLSQVFAGAVANNPMATLNTGVYGMWGGSANDDIVVKMTGLNANNNDYLKLINTLGSSTATQAGVYSKQDLNMDGTLKMTGLNANNNDYLKLLNILGSSTSTLSQPVF